MYEIIIAACLITVTIRMCFPSSFKDVYETSSAFSALVPVFLLPPFPSNSCFSMLRDFRYFIHQFSSLSLSPPFERYLFLFYTPPPPPPPFFFHLFNMFVHFIHSIMVCTVFVWITLSSYKCNLIFVSLWTSNTLF